MLADMQIIRNSSGKGVMAALEKQALSIGTQSWTAGEAGAAHAAITSGIAGVRMAIDDHAEDPLPVEDAADPIAALMPSVLPPDDHLDDDVLGFWWVTSDAGSDINAGKKGISAEIAKSPNDVLFDTDCFSHQYQLICLCLMFGMDALAMDAMGMGSMKFYSTVAAVLHCWRDNADEISSELPPHARKYASRVAPRPISGRWGRLGACLTYLLAPYLDGMHDDVIGAVVRVLKSRSYWQEQERRANQ